MGGRRAAAVLVVFLMALPVVPLGVGAALAAPVPTLRTSIGPGVAPAPRAFDSVSNFEDLGLDGWHASRGAALVTTATTYLGEPSLSSSAPSVGSQVEVTHTNFVTGAKMVSFQAELNYAAGGTGFVGFADGSTPVGVIGIGGGNVWAGPTPARAVIVGSIPTSGTAQPTGWVELYGLLQATAPLHPETAPWTMSVFIDRTDVAAATNLSLPHAGNYTGGIVVTSHGTVDYTDLVFTSLDIPMLIPGYNNMDGYGQGSALTVSVLPAFTTLSATMTLSNWNTPQRGILGTQINAMNYTGTVRNTCRGFFQLGIDIDPHGKIAPWYVPGVNCVATYFATNSTRVNGGFFTPPDTVLSLRITDDPGKHQIVFEIIDYSVVGADRIWRAAIPYSGSEFFGTYTQLEWQPCCSSFPISNYFFNGSIGNLGVSGGNVSGTSYLGADYMVPFALDVPPSWNMGYYSARSASYDQVG